VKDDMLLSHVVCVTMFSASWEIRAGCCNRFGGPLGGVVLSGISHIMGSVYDCGISTVVSPFCSVSGTTGKFCWECRRGDLRRSLVVMSVRFLFSLGSLCQPFPLLSSVSTLSPSVVPCWPPSVGTGNIPGELLRVFLAWTLGVWQMAAGAVGVLGVCGLSWLVVRVFWALVANISVSLFKAFMWRSGWSVFLLASRRSAWVNSWASRLALSHSVSRGTLLCWG